MTGKKLFILNDQIFVYHQSLAYEHGAFVLSGKASGGHGYLPVLGPAGQACRWTAGSAAPHRQRFSNWRRWQRPARRCRARHISTATGQPALPAAVQVGAWRRRGSVPWGGSRVCDRKLSGKVGNVMYLVVGTIGRVQTQSLAVKFLLLHQL